MKDYGMVEMKDLSKDYPSAKEYIEKLLKENNVPKTMIAETLLVFEAICYRIFEQKQNPDSIVTVSGFRSMGDTAIEILYEGGMYDPDPEDPTAQTPEDSILKAYADKIDYIYSSGINRIMITTKRNQLVTVGVYAASVIIGIVLCILLYYTASEKTLMFLGEKIVFPLERFYMSAVLMVGGPVTFLSLLKNLTDTYIISGRQSKARILNRKAVSSSIISVILAVIFSQLFTALLFSDSPLIGKYFHRMLDMDPEVLIPSLMPTDIITPFQSMLPYSLILLAILTTFAFCSIGKHFDRIKGAIDAAHALFSRMLAIVVYALPLFAIFSIMDEIFSDGFISFLYVVKMIAVVFASISILFVYYVIRLCARGIRPLAYFKKMIPLLRENARIASAFDAVPYNIRYCARNYGFDRKNLEQSIPILTQINMDGNCFIITMIAILYVSINSASLTPGECIAIGILVLLLSLGAPSQPGSCIVGLTIVMHFLQAEDLSTVAIIGELFFGGIVNLVNIAGDLVTVASEEVRERESADELNRMLG